MTLDLIREAFASPIARDPNPGKAFAVYRPDGSGPVDPPAPPLGVAPRAAAVLIVLYEERGTPHVLLTRRTEDVPHAGQISFPGGSRDPSDRSLLHTALRETHEELALEPAVLEVVGELAPVYVPPSNFLVTPFVALHAGRPSYRANPGEVAEVLEVPLSLFLDGDAVRRERWTLRGRPYLVRYFRYAPAAGRAHDIWGATARILSTLAAAITAVPVAEAAPPA